MVKAECNQIAIWCKIWNFWNLGEDFDLISTCSFCELTMCLMACFVPFDINHLMFVWHFSSKAFWHGEKGQADWNVEPDSEMCEIFSLSPHAHFMHGLAHLFVFSVKVGMKGSILTPKHFGTVRGDKWIRICKRRSFCVLTMCFMALFCFLLHEGWNDDPPFLFWNILQW